MINFILCDDNLNILDKLQSMLETIFIKHNLDAQVIFQSDNSQEILNYINKNHVDAAILDINLKSDISGLELAQKIRTTNKDIYLIFTTAHLEYLMLAYKVKTFDYLAKPLTLERLEETVLRLFEDITTPSKRFIKISKTFINTDEIQYIEKEGMSLIVNTNSKQYRTSGSFSKLKNLLSDNFVRCHKSYMINVNQIKDVEFSSNKIMFENNKQCYIGPKYKNIFTEVFKNGNIKYNMDSLNNTK